MIYESIICESYTAYDSIGLIDALKAAADDKNAVVVAIFDIASGNFMHDLANKSSHTKMITSTGMLVDSPDSVIDAFLDKLSIRDEIENIRIIG